MEEGRGRGVRTGERGKKRKKMHGRKEGMGRGEEMGR